MARPLRLLREHAWYHITARGNERQIIFRDPADRKRFLRCLADAVARYGWLLHAYVLMPNHYHLLVETPRPNLSLVMQWLQTRYTVGFSRRHQRVGHLFQGRFKSILVDPDSWALSLSSYLHLNPVRVRSLGLDKTARARQRHGLDAPPDREEVQRRLARLRTYRWSSYRAYIGLARAPDWLATDSVLRRIGRGSLEVQRRQYQEYVQTRLRQGLRPSPWEELKAQTILGGQRFVRRVQEQIARSSADCTGRKRLLNSHTWAEVLHAVETVKRQKWMQFRDRYGDSGRDLAFYLARRLAGLKLAELGALAGGVDFRSVGAAIHRFEQKLKQDKHLQKLLQNTQCQIQNAEL